MIAAATVAIVVCCAYALGRRAGRARGYAEGRVAGTVASLEHWAANGLAGRTSAPPSHSAEGADA